MTGSVGTLWPADEDRLLANVLREIDRRATCDPIVALCRCGGQVPRGNFPRVVS